MADNPNPDGKGQTPVLSVLNDARATPVPVPAKQIDQVTTELFTSLFVLESEFNFKPVPGKPYYIYRDGERFWMGITSPAMMSEAVGGRFIGTAVLQADLTWTLTLADAVADDPAFMQWLSDKRAAFEKRLGEAETVDDVLPVYESRFSFYRRASAFGVAHSLSRSMSASGISGLSYDEARGLLCNDPSAPD
ncbi:DUF2452 domain-containing protein [Salinisphaera sp. Q1T1-3]|uniref:DUF2452 domain-containing protein n=1 Tax=Salinisphaera sp. Q1T1-3 TaxID=2321229 RepID=UPI000E73CA19|nr:DUF2452 domain-containing protein [Salinisphaera sp. Q1T1-3]RJS94173.1 DUF2452 domain-containing protein [Salinisphaera sp. Q1T1-3]